MIRLKPLRITLRAIKQKPVKPWLLILPVESQAAEGRASLYWGQCQPGSASPLSQWGHLDAQSSDADWDRLAQLSQQSRTVLLLPAQHVSFFQVTAPKGIKPKEWPLLLEDVTPEDPDNLVIAALKNDDALKHDSDAVKSRTLSLLVTERDRLAAWQGWAQSLNIRLHHWSSPLQLQSYPETTNTLSVTGHPDYWLIKSPTQWLCWPRTLEAQLPPQWHDQTWRIHWDSQHGDGPYQDRQQPISQWLALMAQQLPCDCPRLAPLHPPGMSSLHRWQQRLKCSDRPGYRPFRRSLLAVALLGLSHWGLSSAQQWQTDHSSAEQRTLALAERDIPPQQSARAIRQRLAALAAQQQRQQQIDASLNEVRAQLPASWPPLAQLSVDTDHITLTWPQDKPLSPETQATMAQLGTLAVSPTTVSLQRPLTPAPSADTATTTDLGTDNTMGKASP